MSDFAPGDVVVCLAGKFSTCPNRARHIAQTKSLGRRNPLVVGRFYTVLRCERVGDEVGIVLSDLPERLFCAGRFRRIDPASESFTRQVRACRPIKTKVEA